MIHRFVLYLKIINDVHEFLFITGTDVYAVYSGEVHHSVSDESSFTTYVIP